MSEDQIDWRNLLRMYMTHVLEEEDVTFCSIGRDEGWSPEEIAALVAVEAEAIQAVAEAEDAAVERIRRKQRTDARARGEAGWRLVDPPTSTPSD